MPDLLWKAAGLQLSQKGSFLRQSLSAGTVVLRHRLNHYCVSGAPRRRSIVAGAELFINLAAVEFKPPFCGPATENGPQCERALPHGSTRSGNAIEGSFKGHASRVAKGDILVLG